jgi:hypothetical protein
MSLWEHALKQETNAQNWIKQVRSDGGRGQLHQHLTGEVAKIINGLTHRSKSNSRGSQTYQATVSGMWLMDSICIVVTKLLEDGLNLGVVLSGSQLADNAFEPVDDNLV